MKYFIAALQKYAEFKGRARRKEYWYFVLFVYVFAVPFYYLDVYFESELPTLCYYLIFLVPCLAVTVRRMHDVNKSGWYCLIPIYSLILEFTDGDKGPNKYGSDPKRPEFEEFLSDGEVSASVQ
jgi:uncharacterized membrane protein YhaH (DUF805 family)